MTSRKPLAELADLYVMGLLDPAEAAEVDARLDTDLDLRAAVGAARDRFVALDLTAPVIAPSDGLWDRIAADLVATPTPPLPDPRLARRTEPRPAPKARSAPQPGVARGWRQGAVAALAAVVVLAVGLGWSLTRHEAPQVIAVLLDQSGQPLVLVEDYGTDRARITPLAALDVPAGQALQVWTKPDEATGPVSLGLLRRAESTELTDPARPLPAPRDNQLYEITLEPETGSPTGRPTGPIVVKGFARVPL